MVQSVKGSRLGVVGLGGMGSMHASLLRGLAAEGTHVTEVHAFDDVADVRTKADELGITGHQSLESLIDAVDVVDVCTPTDVHAQVAHAAINAGKHVIVEKPITRTLEEADRLLAAADAAGVQLHVAHVVRYFPEYTAAKHAIANGQIGEPAVIRLTREGGLPAGRPWFLDSKRSGGIICDVMIHDIDFARWVAGDVVRVFGRQLRRVGEDQAVTHAHAILTHASGAISHLTASWAREGVGFRTSFDIAGSTGLLEFATDERAATRTAPPGLLPAGEWLPGDNPWSRELREFLAALHEGVPARVSAADGRAALEIALAAVESAETGRAIDLAPNSTSDLGQVVSA
jgi:predicted dehydrogenase